MRDLNTKVGENEKLILTYINYIDNIFKDLPFYVKIYSSDEYDRVRLMKSSMALRFLGYILSKNDAELNNILDNLKSKKLIEEIDLGYTKAGYHRGILLQITEIGRVFVEEKKSKLYEKIEKNIKDIFSDENMLFMYYLFLHERIPLKLLSTIRKDEVNTLVSAGIINEINENEEKLKYVSLQFKEDVPWHSHISNIDIKKAKEWLKRECEKILSKDEIMLLGFFSECESIILEKHQDWRIWASVTRRTREKYERFFDELVVNFSYLKKLFSFLTHIPTERVEKMISDLEEKGFLVREKNTSCGFPGYILIYRIPVKFPSNLDITKIKQKVKEYVSFLVKEIDKNYKQLIFLDYLTKIYDKENCKFFVSYSMIKDLLEYLSYTPPQQYSQIYVFEKDVILIHPIVKNEIEKILQRVKSNIISDLRTVISELMEKYRNSVLYSCSERLENDCLVINIESPDPFVGIVTFIIAPWISEIDMEMIDEIYSKSTTINLFVFYPTYPQIKRILTNLEKINLAIVRDNEIHLWMRRRDEISHSFFSELSEQFRIIRETDTDEIENDDLERLKKEFPNLWEVRNIIPEAEKLLKDSLREFLKKKFGNDWEIKVRDRLKPELANKWFDKKERKKLKDFIEAMTLGELKNVIEDSFRDFMKECFLDRNLVLRSITILTEKKIYHHGRPERDIPQEELKRVRIAYANLKELISTKKE